MTTKLYLGLSSLATAALVAGSAWADHIWINEFHYDNPGADAGEFVEIAIRTPNGSGFNPSDYLVEFYNGSNGDLYDSTLSLDTFSMINSFVVGSNTFTLYAELSSGIQNGSPDGIALVNQTNSTVESFLSYEGSFTADGDAGGIAGTLGATSTDVGVAEPGTGNLTSLSAMGSGVGANDFGAASFGLTETQTPGQINTGQTFIPAPGALALLGLAALAGRRRR